MAGRALDWQSNHPGARFIGGPGCYGVSAFESYYADLLDPEVGMLDEYVDCWAVRCQIEARRAFAVHFQELAATLSTDMAARSAKLAEEYESVASHMDKYLEAKVDRRSSDAKSAITGTVGRALEHEKQILKQMERI